MDDSIVKSIAEQIPAFSSSAEIVRLIPRFVAAAQTLTVPGVEKRAAVLKCLHNLVDSLIESGKISADSKAEVAGIIDLVAPAAIDAILDVAHGRVVGFEGAPRAAEEPTAPAAEEPTAPAAEEPVPAAAAEPTAPAADCKKSRHSVEEVAIKGVNCILAALKAFYSKKK